MTEQAMVQELETEEIVTEEIVEEVKEVKDSGRKNTNAPRKASDKTIIKNLRKELKTAEQTILDCEEYAVGQEDKAKYYFNLYTKANEEAMTRARRADQSFEMLRAAVAMALENYNLVNEGGK